MPDRNYLKTVIPETNNPILRAVLAVVLAAGASLSLLTQKS
jgi:hypothetical protein